LVVCGSGIKDDICANFGTEVGQGHQEVLVGFPIAAIVNDKMDVMIKGLSEGTDVELVARHSFSGEPSTVEGIQRPNTCEYFTFGPDITRRFLSV
jgi:hypothetical protein